jgi:hypothetical protein
MTSAHNNVLLSWLMTCSTNSERDRLIRRRSDAAAYQLHCYGERGVMKTRRKSHLALSLTACIYFATLAATFSMAADRSPANSHDRSLANGHKVKIRGPIVVREGDVVQILNWKDGSVHGFKVTDRSTISCDKGFLHGKRAMDASVLVPALNVEVAAISNPEGISEAQTIRFNPDPFVVTAAPEKQTRDSCSYKPDLFILSWLVP